MISDSKRSWEIRKCKICYMPSWIPLTNRTIPDVGHCNSDRPGQGEWKVSTCPATARGPAWHFSPLIKWSKKKRVGENCSFLKNDIHQTKYLFEKLLKYYIFDKVFFLIIFNGTIPLFVVSSFFVKNFHYFKFSYFNSTSIKMPIHSALISD